MVNPLRNRGSPKFVRKRTAGESNNDNKQAATKGRNRSLASDKLETSIKAKIKGMHQAYLFNGREFAVGLGFSTSLCVLMTSS
ncbi:hypothetical protein [Catenovulum sediminis]|uniref:Uncharacterized protein n=1 Tax=Catenovulum sediminis TaxID=1740262 RepID=A0ABV1RE45_9ALTE|nr:hypothetical protein [Catenovulum sediminis]